MPIIYDQTYTFEIVILGDAILGDLESETPILILNSLKNMNAAPFFGDELPKRLLITLSEEFSYSLPAILSPLSDEDLFDLFLVNPSLEVSVDLGEAALFLTFDKASNTFVFSSEEDGNFDLAGYYTAKMTLNYKADGSKYGHSASYKLGISLDTKENIVLLELELS